VASIIITYKSRKDAETTANMSMAPILAALIAQETTPSAASPTSWARRTQESGVCFSREASSMPALLVEIRDDIA
jgi:hypothetical protein